MCVCVGVWCVGMRMTITHTNVLQFRGKWFAMKFLLDTPISLDKRAIQFSNSSSSPSSAAGAAGDSSEQVSERTRAQPLDGMSTIIKVS